MNFFTVRDLRTSPKNVWDTLAREKEVVITNNGKPSALMIPITDANFDDILAAVRQVNAIRAVSRMQRAAVKAGLDKTSLDEINAEITAARAERQP
jgi:antitoxin (DNA-binding transcriptional repressor) of toxin-antitoxin stability system